MDAKMLPSSAMKAYTEAWVVASLLAIVGCLLYAGDLKIERDRRKRKLKKINDYSSLRKKYRAQITAGASVADKSVSIAVQKPKYWPGDHIALLKLSPHEEVMVSDAKRLHCNRETKALMDHAHKNKLGRPDTTVSDAWEVDAGLAELDRKVETYSKLFLYPKLALLWCPIFLLVYPFAVISWVYALLLPAPTEILNRSPLAFRVYGAFATLLLLLPMPLILLGRFLDGVAYYAFVLHHACSTKGVWKRRSSNLKVIAPYRGRGSLNAGDVLVCAVGQTVRKGPLSFARDFTTMFLVVPWLKYFVTANVWVYDLGERFSTQTPPASLADVSADQVANRAKEIVSNTKIPPEEYQKRRLDLWKISPHFPNPPPQRRWALGLQTSAQNSATLLFSHVTHSSAAVDGSREQFTVSNSAAEEGELWRVVMWYDNPYHLLTGFAEINVVSSSAGPPSQASEKKKHGGEQPMWLISGHSPLTSGCTGGRIRSGLSDSSFFNRWLSVMVDELSGSEDAQEQEGHGKGCCISKKTPSPEQHTTAAVSTPERDEGERVETGSPSGADTLPDAKATEKKNTSCLSRLTGRKRKEGGSDDGVGAESSENKEPENNEVRAKSSENKELESKEPKDNEEGNEDKNIREKKRPWSEGAKENIKSVGAKAKTKMEAAKAKRREKRERSKAKKEESGEEVTKQTFKEKRDVARASAKANWFSFWAPGDGIAKTGSGVLTTEETEVVLPSVELSRCGRTGTIRHPNGPLSNRMEEVGKYTVGFEIYEPTVNTSSGKDGSTTDSNAKAEPMGPLKRLVKTLRGPLSLNQGADNSSPPPCVGYYGAERLVFLTSRVEDRVIARFPDRDWNEEELEEIEHEPSVLFLVLELVFFPARVMLYKLCCEVQRVRKVVAMKKPRVDEHDNRTSANHAGSGREKSIPGATNTLRSLLYDTDDDEEEDDEEHDAAEPMIEGFPIDCGTKNHKFLSMSKAMAVTSARHPHLEVTAEAAAQDGDEKAARRRGGIRRGDSVISDDYTQPFELWRDLGQHNIQAGPLAACLPEALVLRPRGLIEQYGIGMSLYFKFVKACAFAFAVTSVCALLPMAYYMGSSAWSPQQRALYLGVNYNKYLAFFTSVGSLGGRSWVCGMGFDAERVALSCPAGGGVITRLEAYYGDPLGSCSCPPHQNLLPSTGRCPAQPDFTNSDVGECKYRFGEDADHAGDLVPCFRGQMWNGEQCCANALEHSNDSPDLADLALSPFEHCNSASAQYIAQALCLGRSNCTIPISASPNRTFVWEVSKSTPCVDGETWETDFRMNPKTGTLVSTTLCRATFQSPSSNFSQCPFTRGEFSSVATSSSNSSRTERRLLEGSSRRRFIVRGLCDSSTFSGVEWIREKSSSRLAWAQGMSWLDALLNSIMFGVALWLASKEGAAVEEEDRCVCSLDDFTLRVLHLPPPLQGETPDLDRLRKSLTKHFEAVAKAQPAVIMERSCRVVDINMGLNNQEQLKAMRKRGQLARLLDLEIQKLKLMGRKLVNDDDADEGGGTEKAVHEQAQGVRALKVRFVEACEKVRTRNRRLEARTAFVTFDSEEAYERVKRAYSSSPPSPRPPPPPPLGHHNSESLPEETIETPTGSTWSSSSLFISHVRHFLGLDGQPERLRWKGTAQIIIEDVMRPSDYLWENVATPREVVALKTFISNALALLILIVGFTCIIAAKGAETSTLLRLGQTDCTLYEFAYSGDPSWSSATQFNFTQPNALTRLDVASHMHPEHYNNSFPNPGLLGCFCLSLLSNSEVGPNGAQEVAIRNPHTNTDEFPCAPFLEEYAEIQLYSTLAVLSVVAVNKALQSVLRLLVAFEGHETQTEEITAHTSKMFGSMLISTAFIVILLAGNLNVVTGGRQSGHVRFLESASLLSGPLADFTSTWYLEVGSAIAVTMAVNVVALSTPALVSYVKLKLARCLDRGCSLNMHRTTRSLQVQLEDLYTGPALLLEERYAALLVVYFVCVMFAAGLPCLWLIAGVSFFVCFLVEKWAFLRVYRLPPMYGATLAKFATSTLPWASLAHAAVAVWAFTVPDLFGEGLWNEEENVAETPLALNQSSTSFSSSPTFGINTRDHWKPDPPRPLTIRSCFERLLFHQNALPHVIFMAVWGAWYVLFRVLKLDDILSYLVAFSSSVREICLQQKNNVASTSRRKRQEKEMSDNTEIQSDNCNNRGNDEVDSSASRNDPDAGDHDDGKSNTVNGKGDNGEVNGVVGGAPSAEISDDVKYHGNNGDVSPIPPPPPTSTLLQHLDGGSGVQASGQEHESEEAGPYSVFLPAAPEGAGDVAWASASWTGENGVLGIAGRFFLSSRHNASGSSSSSSSSSGDSSSSSSSNGVSERYSSGSGGSGDEAATKALTRALGVHRLHGALQQSLSESEAARIDFENHVWQTIADEEGEPSSGCDKTQRARQFFSSFLKLYHNERGCARLDHFFASEAKRQQTLEQPEQALPSATSRGNGEIDDEVGDIDFGSTSTMSFRVAYLSRCDQVRKSQEKRVAGGTEGGAGEGGEDRSCEGNADFLWSIPTEMLTSHLHSSVLQPEVLNRFEAELEFRSQHPKAFNTLIDRKLRGLLTYDYNGNEAYLSAFALDSKSMKAYLRGNLQVSGDDFQELWKRRSFSSKCLSWAAAALSSTTKSSILNTQAISSAIGLVIFPDVSKDLGSKQRRHTTQVGITPTDVSGPRLVLNVRVPPKPKNLTSQEELFGRRPSEGRGEKNNQKSQNRHDGRYGGGGGGVGDGDASSDDDGDDGTQGSAQVDGDEEEHEYDETMENWQYVQVAIKGVFEWKLRLPKGLQHHRIPEFQIEVPACLDRHSVEPIDRPQQQQQLCDSKPMAHQKLQAAAPPGIDRGNRIQVSVPGVGLLHVDWPAYSRQGQPAQFHLPSVSAHHLNTKATANCHVVVPKSAETLRSEFNGRTAAKHQGWVALHSPLDESGLLSQSEPSPQPTAPSAPEPPHEKTSWGCQTKQQRVRAEAYQIGLPFNVIAPPPPSQGIVPSVDTAEKCTKHAANSENNPQTTPASSSASLEPAAAATEEAKDGSDRSFLKMESGTNLEPKASGDGVFKPFYENPARHRVWYQVMAFASRAVLKDFQDLSLFAHEIAEPIAKGGTVLTLRPQPGGSNFQEGESIECRVPLFGVARSGGQLVTGVHGQRVVIRVPGLGEGGRGEGGCDPLHPPPLFEALALLKRMRIQETKKKRKTHVPDNAGKGVNPSFNVNEEEEGNKEGGDEEEGEGLSADLLEELMGFGPDGVDRGYRAVTLLATDEVTLRGLHGVPLRAAGCLPWGARALERRVMVPTALDEVVFDYPALRALPLPNEREGEGQDDTKAASVPFSRANGRPSRRARKEEQDRRRRQRYLRREIYAVTVSFKSKERKAEEKRQSNRVRRFQEQSLQVQKKENDEEDDDASSGVSGGESGSDEDGDGGGGELGNTEESPPSSPKKSSPSGAAAAAGAGAGAAATKAEEPVRSPHKKTATATTATATTGLAKKTTRRLFVPWATKHEEERRLKKEEGKKKKNSDDDDTRPEWIRKQGKEEVIRIKRLGCFNVLWSPSLHNRNAFLENDHDAAAAAAAAVDESSTPASSSSSSSPPLSPPCSVQEVRLDFPALGPLHKKKSQAKNKKTKKHGAPSFASGPSSSSSSSSGFSAAELESTLGAGASEASGRMQVGWVLIEVPSKPTASVLCAQKQLCEAVAAKAEARDQLTACAFALEKHKEDTAAPATSGSGGDGGGDGGGGDAANSTRGSLTSDGGANDDDDEMENDEHSFSSAEEFKDGDGHGTQHVRHFGRRHGDGQTRALARRVADAEQTSLDATRALRDLLRSCCGNRAGGGEGGGGESGSAHGGGREGEANPQANPGPVYLRLPAYVTKRSWALANLPPQDQASPQWRLAPSPVPINNTPCCDGGRGDETHHQGSGAKADGQDDTAAAPAAAKTPRTGHAASFTAGGGTGALLDSFSVAQASARAVAEEDRLISVIPSAADYAPRNGGGGSSDASNEMAEIRDPGAATATTKTAAAAAAAEITADTDTASKTKSTKKTAAAAATKTAAVLKAGSHFLTSFMRNSSNSGAGNEGGGDSPPPTTNKLAKSTTTTEAALLRRCMGRGATRALFQGFNAWRTWLITCKLLAEAIAEDDSDDDSDDD